MANLLDKYGIKEVADVVFYELDSTTHKPNYSKPVLYLDTLKVSTIEQTAENVSARGGKGNPELVTWDYNKEITLTLEDALFSAKSLAFMFGENGAQDTTAATVTQMVNPEEVTVTGGTYYWKLPGNREDNKAYANVGSTVTFLLADGTTTDTATKTGEEWKASTTPVKGIIISYTPTTTTTIKIDSNKFPGQYAIIGDTFARPQGSTNDEMFQFIIWNAKVNSEVTLTLEAEGDPTTFNMSIRVLKPQTGNTMMSLIKYDVTGTALPS